jgi:hypothetical protein
VDSVAHPTSVVDCKGEPEKSDDIWDDTLIREGVAAGAPSDVVPGAMVVVIGSPADDGAVAAQLIRIFPAAPASPAP